VDPFDQLVARDEHDEAVCCGCDDSFAFLARPQPLTSHSCFVELIGAVECEVKGPSSSSRATRRPIVRAWRSVSGEAAAKVARDRRLASASIRSVTVEPLLSPTR
jgi:hypothetical protein